jgi:hypothetical protein
MSKALDFGSEHHNRMQIATKEKYETSAHANVPYLRVK